MFTFPWILSFFVGFLSLSQEILWVRILGHAYGNVPQVFSFILSSYLLGIALGAAFGKRLCARSTNLYASAALVLCTAALFDALILKPAPFFAFASTQLLGLQAVLIALSAAIKSSLFPVVHQLGSDSSGPRLARSVSRIYFGNIMGSALGPLVTGFIALDRISVDACFAISSGVCLALAALSAAKGGRRSGLVATGVAIAAAAYLVFPLPADDVGILANLSRWPITHYVANRNGVIYSAPNFGGNAVYGGNMYDGMAVANVDSNRNHLDRLYILGVLHANPKHVLVVGMSSGAWTRAVEGFPTVETIDVVEINPGYVQLTRAYPELAPLLDDKRLRLHIDDGRRWLKRHPAMKFDLIVQNTTWHFRANVSNLVSREYFGELKTHLNPSGIVALNTTGSFDILATGAAVFAHAYRYANFLYASDVPLSPDLTRLATIHRPDGALFSLDSPVVPGSVVDALTRAKLDPAGPLVAKEGVGADIVSDDNMLTEYRHGEQFLWGVIDSLVRHPVPQF